MDSRYPDALRLPSSIGCVQEYLQGRRLFRTLPDDVLKEIAVAIRERSYLKGHHLYYAGDTLSYVFIIRSGLVVMTELDRRGNHRAPITFGPGDVLGLATATLDNRWTWTATAVVTTDVFLVPIETFLSLYTRSPQFAHQIASELSRLVLRSEQATVRFAQTPIASRVASFLLEYSNWTPAQQRKPLCFDLPLSHQDMSLVLGTSRETVTRILARLCRAKLIAVDGQQVLILQPEALHSLAEG